MRQLKQLAACLALTTAALAAAPVYADAIITNGSGLYLGVNDEGHLNVTDGNVAANSGATGLSWTWADGAIRDATSPGCYCEGFGFGADNGIVHSGYANEASGISNIVAGPMSSTASTANTTASLGSLAGLVITHAYAPSVSPNAYEVTVTITNTTGGSVNDVRYMRAMDWDIPMTEFAEYVTLFGWPATNLIATSNDGFDESNPFGGSPADIGGGCGTNVNFTDCGAYDHGAAFIFGFGSLADGESISFRIFYGAGDNEREAYAALAAVGAEVGSLGYSNDGAGGPNRGSPVYFFGFAGVGGTPIPEPASIALMGLGLLGFAASRRRSK